MYENVHDTKITRQYCQCKYILLTLVLFSVHTAVECSPLTTIANGVITYAPDTTSNYDLGTVATYTCDAGFVLDLSLGGSVTRTCFDDMDNDAEGLFSGQAPACIRKFIISSIFKTVCLNLHGHADIFANDTQSFSLLQLSVKSWNCL